MTTSEDSTTPLRRCTQCQKEFPRTAEYFHRSKSKANGLMPQCKSCRSRNARLRYLKNSTRINQKAREWQVKNRDKTRIYARRWRLNNLEKDRMKAQRRYNLKRALPTTLTSTQWQACLNWWHGCCAYCGRQRDFWNVIEQEHFIPLTLGGGYTADNIIPSCTSCNSSKFNHSADVWVTRKFGVRKGKQILDRIEVYFEHVKVSEAQ